MRGLKNGKRENSFKGPSGKPQTTKTDACTRQISRNSKKNVISGLLYKYDMLRNSQHDFYSG